jgi:hypothetical protein
MSVAAVKPDFIAGVLPKQTIDFKVPNPSATAQLSLPLYQGAGYRADFKTWSLLVNGGFMLFNLNLSEAIPVAFTLSVAASLVNGQSNCPITITVNGAVFVKSYSDHNDNFHPVSWTIPAAMLHTGDNRIQVTLDASATTQLFINATTVDQAVLPVETINLSVPEPNRTPQFWLQAHSGAGYRADFKTWSLLTNGGFLLFDVSLGTAIPVQLTLSLCASLVGGKANCPITITVNNRPFVAGFKDTNDNFHPFTWEIPQNLLRAGLNTVQVTLDPSASTQIFVNQAVVSGE